MRNRVYFDGIAPDFNSVAVLVIRQKLAEYELAVERFIYLKYIRGK